MNKLNFEIAISNIKNNNYVSINPLLTPFDIDNLKSIGLNYKDIQSDNYIVYHIFFDKKYNGVFDFINNKLDIVYIQDLIELYKSWNRLQKYQQEMIIEFLSIKDSINSYEIYNIFELTDFINSRIWIDWIFYPKQDYKMSEIGKQYFNKKYNDVDIPTEVYKYFNWPVYGQHLLDTPNFWQTDNGVLYIDNNY